jgi:hypothetical protein
MPATSVLSFARRAVQRQLDDPFGVDHFAERGRGDVDRRRLAGDRHGFRDVTELDREADRHELVGLQQHALALRRPESAQFDGDVVGARTERRQPVAAVDAGDRLARQAGRNLDGLDRGARQNGIGVVGDHTVDLASLSERGACEKSAERDTEHDSSEHGLPPLPAAAVTGLAR